MSLAGTAAITELWAKCKEWFGRSVSASTTATTVSIQLKNNAGNNLGSAATIAAATSTAAGALSADDKDKLDGIADGANNYTHPTYTSKSSGLYKVTVDGTGHVSDATAVAKADITALGIPGTDTNTHYTAVPRAGASTGTGNAAQSDPYVKIIENSAISGSIQLKAGSNMSISSNASGVVTFAATDTNTDTKVTSVDNHYAPSRDSNSDLTASGATGTAGSTIQVVTGIQRDAKGHVTGIVSGAATDTDTKVTAVGNHYVPSRNSASDLTASGASGTSGTTLQVITGIQRDAKGHVTGIVSGAATDTTYSDATTSAHGLMTASDKTKLNGIATGAEVNQNAFSNIAIGDTTIAANVETDTIEIEAGDNVTLEADTTNDKITIHAENTTYSDATTSAHGLMTAADKTKLNGIATGAEVNVQSDWSQSTTTADDYIKNKPTLGTAAAKNAGNAVGNVPLVGTSLGTTANKIVVTDSSGALKPSSYTVGAASAKAVDTSISSGSTSTNLPTSAAVVSYVASQVSGATAFQGIADSNTDISGAAPFVAGYYWVIGTAGTYVGQTCEVGDMVFCTESSSTYSASNFSVVQNNIVEMTAAEVDAICV